MSNQVRQTRTHKQYIDLLCLMGLLAAKTLTLSLGPAYLSINSYVIVI